MLNIPVKNPLVVQLVTIGAGIAAVLVAHFAPHYSELLGQILNVLGISAIGVASASFTAKKPSEPQDADETVRIIPPPSALQPQDRSRLHNDRQDEPAEFRALPLALACLLLVGCAASQRLPCDESKLRAIDAAYLAEVGKHCLKYASAAECPELPELRAKHSQDLKAVCP